MLADEQEDMIDKYIDRGTMFILVDVGVKAECVVTDESSGVLEIKNIWSVLKRTSNNKLRFACTNPANIMRLLWGGKI